MSTYVYEFKPNNKVCAGLMPVGADMLALGKGELTLEEYMLKLDPESLLLVTAEKYFP
jgi:hypothetical protein